MTPNSALRIAAEKAGEQKKVAEARLRTAFTSLKHRNYRLWFWGQMVSLFGTWMQMTAQGFLIYELTGSSAYLGLASFMFGMPVWLFTLYSGVILDRVSRKRILLITQISMMILAFALAALTFTGTVRPWHILVLSFLLGAANAFDAPARHAFVPDIVPREDLQNAVSLNGIMFNTSTIVGPALGGLIYAMVGAGWCFVLNGLSFLAIIIGLMMMRLSPFVKREHSGSVMSEMRAGVKYVRNSPVLLGVICIMATAGLFGLSFMTLIPAWSVAVLGGDSKTNGMLQAARGLGALLVVMWLASLGNIKTKGRLITLGSFAVPLLTFVFALARTFPASFTILLLVGMANVLITNLSAVLVQLNSEESYRGRVMGIYSFVFMGTMPLGSLWIGSAAGMIGEPSAIIICGAATLVCAALIWRLIPSLRMAE